MREKETEKGRSDNVTGAIWYDRKKKKKKEEEKKNY